MSVEVERVDFVSFLTNDIARAKAFYTDVLGLEVEGEGEPHPKRMYSIVVFLLESVSGFGTRDEVASTVADHCPTPQACDITRRHSRTLEQITSLSLAPGRGSVAIAYVSPVDHTLTRGAIRGDPPGRREVDEGGCRGGP